MEERRRSFPKGRGFFVEKPKLEQQTEEEGLMERNLLGEDKGEKEEEIGRRRERDTDMAIKKIKDELD